MAHVPIHCASPISMLVFMWIESKLPLHVYAQNVCS